MTEPTPSADPAGQPTTEPPAEPTQQSELTTPPAGDPPNGNDDKPLGPNGEKALRAERARADELERRMNALAPLQKLAEALATTGGPTEPGKSEIELITERLANHETELKSERVARWRAEVANTKQLTAEQAAELRGDTAEELAAHADRLLSLFPPAAPAAPGIPKPDPSQGARGPVGMDARIAEAEKNGDVRTALALKSQQLQQLSKK